MTAQYVANVPAPSAGDDYRKGLERLCRRHGTTIAHLGRATEIGAQNLRDRLARKTRLSIEEADAVAAQFGCDVIDVIELGRGNDPKGLLLWPQLRLVASNDATPRSPLRSPLLLVVPER